MNESTASMGMMILWMVVIFGVMYFLMIRPQKKQKKPRKSNFPGNKKERWSEDRRSFCNFLVTRSDP